MHTLEQTAAAGSKRITNPAFVTPTFEDRRSGAGKQPQLASSQPWSPIILVSTARRRQTADAGLRGGDDYKLDL